MKTFKYLVILVVSVFFIAGLTATSWSGPADSSDTVIGSGVTAKDLKLREKGLPQLPEIKVPITAHPLCPQGMD